MVVGTSSSYGLYVMAAQPGLTGAMYNRLTFYMRVMIADYEIHTLKLALNCLIVVGYSRELVSRHNELEKIQVQGHLIKSGTGITTRSKAKSAPDQWVMLPLPTKIVALLADALTEIQEQVLAGEDEGSDWEEVQTDGIESDKEFLHSVSALGKPSYEHLEAMAKVFNEDQDDQYEDDLLNVADPLNQINLARDCLGVTVAQMDQCSQFPLARSIPVMTSSKKLSIEAVQQRVSIVISELLSQLQDWNNRRQFTSPIDFHADGARVATAVGVSINVGGWCCCLAAPTTIPFTIATRYSDVRR
ncbi:hypothetical protein KIW84_023099 [Lathyrus oleraceus]|uniref:Uncharacterized protein n=1 Tax=Pisum sativum TaxID=3888 RepID=A0A9D4YC36_PEA|nr:hypothetical protein KIW84_023099 [Pisum sativum]